MNRLQKRLQYEFNDVGLLKRALTHRSAGNQNNERLEFLGDSILGFEVADVLYHQANKADEGQLSRMRAHLVKKESLALIGRNLELSDLLKLGQGELRSGGQTRDSILADAVEAIIAAVYLDGGMDEARALVRRMLGERLHSPTPEIQEKDPKTQLQERLQSRKYGLPTYEVVRTEGHQHAQTFYVMCTVKDLNITAKGKGSSRRKAEQDAANTVLNLLAEEHNL